MNHPSDDELLLLAYGELPLQSVAPVEAHAAHCPICQATLAGFERARVALDVARPARRRPVAAWAAFGLAVAAVLAIVLIGKAGPTRGADGGWRPTTTWSATAGYVAGGKAMVDLDAQLTRLEQESYYGRP